jgi:hypothetical protein
MREVKGTTYISTSLVHLPHGKSWLSISAADLGANKIGDSFAAQADPTQGLQFLSAFNGNPVVVGHESIGGASTTHYKFTVDLNSLYAREAKAGKKLNVPGMSEGLNQLKQSGVDLANIPAEAWIDNAGRVRKFQYTLVLTVEGQTASATGELTFSDFDAPVSVSAPPASDVESFRNVPDFFTQLAAGGSTS